MTTCLTKFYNKMESSNENKDDMPTIKGDVGSSTKIQVLANDLIITKSGEYPLEVISRVWFMEGRKPIIIYEGYISMIMPCGLPENIIIGSKITFDNRYALVVFNPKTEELRSSWIYQSHPFIKFKLVDENLLVVLKANHVEVWDFIKLDFKYYLCTQATDFKLLSDGNIIANTGKSLEVWNPHTGDMKINMEFSYLIADIVCLTDNISITTNIMNTEIRCRRTGHTINLGEYSYYNDIFTLNNSQVFTRDIKGIVRIYDLKEFTVDIRPYNEYLHCVNKVKLLTSSSILIATDIRLIVWNVFTNDFNIIFECTEHIIEFGTFQDGRIYVIVKGMRFSPPILKLISPE